MTFTQERAELVRRLQDQGSITTSAVAAALLEVPRERFVPEPFRSEAYRDAPLPIGLQQNISAPHMVAIMCERLELAPGQRVLEIGTGSGYHAAVVAQLVGPPGRVVTIERLAGLAASARANLAAANVTNVHVVEGDGSQGYAAEAPYDRIYLTCAAPAVPPPLKDQLKEGGLLLSPVGSQTCELVRLRRDAGIFSEEDLGPCAFVPLVGQFGFPT